MIMHHFALKKEQLLQLVFGFFTEILHNVLGICYISRAMFHLRTPGKQIVMSTFLLIHDLSQFY
jgi:hypothetical protein